MTRLTPRELDVLEAVARGLSNSEAAEHLHVGCEAVKSHLRNARRKLGAKNRTHAVRLAQERGHCLYRTTHRAVHCPFCEREFHIELPSTEIGAA